MDSLKNVKGLENIEEEIVSETYMTPLDFESKFNAYNGACFGLQPTLTQSNHMRPQSKAKTVKIFILLEVARIQEQECL